jgi:copper chaperone NosL
VRRALAIALAAAACTSGAPAPAALDTKNEWCGFCRMAVSDQRFAGQLVAPHEEPRFFDDIGCLGRYVSGTKALPPGTIAYVADHRTKAWAPAAGAVYTRVAGLETPMGSHLIAHADSASRDADPEAKAGTPVPVTELFGAGGAPGGAR